MENINEKFNVGEKKRAPEKGLEGYIESDYGNQYCFLGAVFRMDGIQGVKDYLLGRIKNQSPFHMQTYEEVGKRSSGYEVTAKNKENVKKLNELAKHMNEITKNPDTLTEENFRKTHNELDVLTHGEETI